MRVCVCVCVCAVPNLIKIGRHQVYDIRLFFKNNMCKSEQNSFSVAKYIHMSDLTQIPIMHAGRVTYHLTMVCPWYETVLE